ncbi:uncharacterized protein LOC111876645 [Lactuca sativa]|uniref:uncharacterized protein LOC111876645 n=1 Tax=Lactuca sativa TaxID=4236 RepID=UPI000CD89194|nr:uncharacterized protein LOC111876645 [Lactuca sativa]
MGGHRYTYFCQSDPKMSKLDRFMICPRLLNHFPKIYVVAVSREPSDHCPIILQSVTEDFGKTPFRFFNSRMNKDGFGQVVTKAWESFVGYGTHDRYLAAKLKFFKNEIKKWRVVDYPNEVKELHTLKLKLQELDVAYESRELYESEIEERRVMFQKIVEHEKIVALDAKQKAMIRWAINGDENTSFFHSFVNIKQQKNHIHGLVINGEWNTNAYTIKQEIHRFFRMKFQENWPTRPRLIN